MSQSFPKIRIKHGWLLQDAFVDYMEKIPEYKAQKEPTKDEMDALVSERKDIWNSTEKNVLEAMEKITGLKFLKNIIDVYTVYGWKSAFSDPLVVGIKYKGDDFVDVLTHELLHTLLTDNVQKVDGPGWVKNQYPDQKDKKVINHILLHAVHKEIYLSLGWKNRLEKDIKKSQKWLPYKIAWDIVERDDSKQLVAKFREDNKL